MMQGAYSETMGLNFAHIKPFYLRQWFFFLAILFFSTKKTVKGVMQTLSILVSCFSYYLFANLTKENERLVIKFVNIMKDKYQFIMHLINPLKKEKLYHKKTNKGSKDLFYNMDQITIGISSITGLSRLKYSYSMPNIVYSSKRHSIYQSLTWGMIKCNW